MKRGQLGAVIMIVVLVAVVAAFLTFSQKRVGRAYGTVKLESYMPKTCEDTTVTINNKLCVTPPWLKIFQDSLNVKCGKNNCKATIISATAAKCVYKIDCK